MSETSASYRLGRLIGFGAYQKHEYTLPNGPDFESPDAKTGFEAGQADAKWLADKAKAPVRRG